MMKKYKGPEVDGVLVIQSSRFRGQPSSFFVSYRVIDTGQYWSREFAIRDPLGNPTEIGRKMGIRARDKRISSFSLRGESINKYLHKLAWKYARGLMTNGAEVIDRTAYATA